MRQTRSKKLISMLLAVLMLTGCFSVQALAADTDASTSSKGTTLQELSETLNAITYEEYMATYSGVERGTNTITINAVDYDSETTTADVSVVNNYEGQAGDSLQIDDSGTVVWSVDIPKTGMYAIKITYCSVTDKTNSIERVFYINGKVPFSEARYLLMKKTWVNEYTDGRFKLDINGNELRPTTDVVPEWKEYTFTDSNGYYADPFEFYFSEGVNTISLEAVREEMVIQEITIFPYEDLPTYEEVQAEYAAKGYTEATAEPIYIAAETPTATSDYTIYPLNDRTSAITEPQDAALQMLNSIGSDKWQTVGQWVKYTFEVQESGIYNIVTRFKQSELNGLYTSRKLRIDGEIPFEEANYCRFVYNNQWQVEALNNGKDEFGIYLEAGTHTIELEVTLGEMGDILRRVNEILDSINDDYLEILKLTGASPDSYRDYGFGRVMPDVVIDLVVQSQAIREVIEYIENMSGVKSENTATLEQIAILLEKMGTDENEIAKNLSNLKSYIGTLGTWINDVTNQPLQLDYIVIQGASEALPKAAANIGQSLAYAFKQFFASFYTDYNSLGTTIETTGDEENMVSVWVVTGRDQATIMRNLIDNDFISATGISVELKLVAGGTLLPSVLAGVGPDVAWDGTDPIQYAIRSAVQPLNDYEGFDEVTTRFASASLGPLTLYGKTYGLPFTTTWPMMFYRTDILADLGLEVPETWEDLISMIPVLQFNNMEIGLTTDYQTLLYQMGDTLWTDDGMRINLDSNTSLEAFEMMCNWFTQYSLDYSYSFANRFRTGEMPIGISSYIDTYNQLVVFATELAGLWSFSPIPGIEQEDGTINNVAVAGVGSIIMLSGAKNSDGAWQFMKWFTDKQFQVDYSNELVAVVGNAAKNATANIEALEELPWTSAEYSALYTQMQNLVGIPSYPGNYILARYTNFAFLDAYNNLADPVDSLLGYINTINKEITRKRTEFKLETLEIGETLTERRLGQAAEAIDAMSDSVKSQYSEAIALLDTARTSEKADDINAAIEAFKEDENQFADVIAYLETAAEWAD